MIPVRKRPALSHYDIIGKVPMPADPMSEIANSLKILAERMATICVSQQKIISAAAGHDRNAKMPRMEQRFQRIYEDVPVIPDNTEGNQEERSHQIQIWLGKLCEEVFSITFSMLQYEKLSDRKSKAFCCENMLSNIIKMIRKNNLTADQIYKIDKCLKDELIPYFLMKYPMSEEAEVNLQFASKIIETDSVKENDNDLIFKSRIEFDYHEDGNYNREIMKFINYVIELPNTRIQGNNQNLFKLFCNDMENFFKNVEEEEFTIRMSKYNFRELKKKEDGNAQLTTEIMTEITHLTLEQQKLKQKYRENVRGYTKKLIGRKISQNVKPFSQIEIKQGDLKLKNPAVMRIITKWCQELMENFETTRNILNKEHQFRMKDGSQRILKRKHLLMLSQLLKREKKKVDQFLTKVNINNSECQFDFGSQEVPKKMKKFCEEECEVGLFASSVISNYQTYLVGYVNTIIHALMSASKCYQEMVKAYEYKQDQYGQYIQKWMDGTINFEDLLNRAYSYRLASVSVSYISFIPQLVSFRVGDILRCKCTSKQKQVIALYTELERLSRKEGSGMKIVRVKDRLEKGTKDILINILYKNTLLIEMQLAVTTNRTKFIDFSNKYNHVLYELKRAEFGPISEMCNIWINNDIKADFYITQARLLNSRQAKPISKKDHTCEGDPIQFPFRCSECKYFYNDCNYVLKHIQCKVKGCRKNICSLCRAQKCSYADLKSLFSEIPSIDVLGMKPSETFEDFRKRTSGQKGSEEFMGGQESTGMLLDLKGEDRKPMFYKNVKYGRKNFIIHIKDFRNCEMRMLKELIDKEQIRAFKKEYLIFSSKGLTEFCKQISIQNQNRFITEYNFPHLMKKWYAKEKQSIVFMYGDLRDQDLRKIQLQYPFAKKTCFFHNEITDFELFMSRFNESQIIDLGENKVERLAIKDFVAVGKDSLKILYLNYNNLKEIQPSFVQRFKSIEELELSNNYLASLPSCFTDLQNLKIMNLSRNGFTELPDEVTHLKNLRILNLYSSKNRKEKLSSLPKSFGNLLHLRKLNLNFNALVQLPESFGNLQNLEILSAIGNLFQKLPPSFVNLRQLKILILAENNFKVFPIELGSLTKLEILNLEASSKNNEQKKVLPDCYCNLVSMKMMDVSQNKIDQLPSRIGDMKMLETLFIYENKLKELPPSIGHLKKLRLLYASNNELKTLPDEICQLQNLEKLTIKENVDLHELPNNFGNLKKLKYLICNGNSITDLPPSFHQLQNLRELLMKDNKIKRISPAIKLNLISRLQLDLDKLDPESKRLINSLKT